MLAIKSDVEANKLRPRSRFQVGDRVITSNCRLGTVVRIDRDELGEYIVARLDIIPGEFVYDPCDLEKV